METSDDIKPQAEPPEKPIESPVTENPAPEQVNNIREVSPISSRSSSSAVSLTENANKQSPPQVRSPVFAGLTQRQLLMLTTFACTEFFGAMVYSIHGPFFPKEASRKGVSASQFGFTFGAFELAALLTSPLFSKMLRSNSIQPNSLYHIGVFTTGITAVLFSLIGFITDPATFFISSIVIRTIEGIGEGAFITASFTLIAEEFPEAITSTFGSMQTFFGLGIICGPVMGGALNDALYTDDGRFTLTFGVLGSVLTLSGVLGLFILPKAEVHAHELGGRKSILPGKVLAMLRVGSIRLASFAIVSAAVSVGFIAATLELHLRPFNLHPVILGGVFVLNGGVYAISAPVWGWLIEKLPYPKAFTFLGALLVIEGFLLIGPATFIPVETSLLLICVGLCLHGLGVAAILVSSFKLSLWKAVQFGYETSIATYGTVSSLWMLMFSFGCFIASTAGILYDNFGFRSSTWLVMGMQTILMLVTVLSIWNTRNSQTTRHFQIANSEQRPLLSSTNPIPDQVKSSNKYGAA